MFIHFDFTSIDFSFNSFFNISFFKFFTSNINNIDANTNANPSANGPAYNIPLIPQKFHLNIIIAGIKNTICLDIDNIALFILFPIAWKNIPDGI